MHAYRARTLALSQVEVQNTDCVIKLFSTGKLHCFVLKLDTDSNDCLDCRRDISVRCTVPCVNAFLTFSFPDCASVTGRQRFRGKIGKHEYERFGQQHSRGSRR